MFGKKLRHGVFLEHRTKILVYFPKGSASVRDLSTLHNPITSSHDSAILLQSATRGHPHSRDTFILQPLVPRSRLRQGIKDLVVTSSRCWHSPAVLVTVEGTDIERVIPSKYLSVLLNNKLDCSDNMVNLEKKPQNRLFLLRRMRAFSVKGTLLITFDDSGVASVIF